jgi:calcineurin-like phosphoesterase family protein
MIQKHCRRPSDVDLILITNWKRLVLPEDLVIHLGDVAWGFLAKDKVLLDWMSDLPGTKFLIKGNHDSHGNEHYLRNGFSSVCNGMVMSSVFLSHRAQKIIPDGCYLNVHGHSHNNVPRDHKEFPHCKLFAVEYEDYSPRIFEKFCREGKK